MELSAVLDSMQPDGDGWRIDVPADWQQGRTLYGGLQLALAVRAMRGVLPAPLPLRSVQVTFVGPLAGDDISAHADLLRVGRTASHARGELRQAGRIGCTAVGIFGASRLSAFALGLEQPVVPVDPETLTDLPVIDGITPRFVEHLQLRWAIGAPPQHAHDEPHSTVYARLRDRRCPPEDALIALADAIPTPAVSMLRHPAPVNSLNWMLEILGDPAGFDPHGWCRLDTDVRAGADGYLSQTSILWGPDGRAWTVSHQTVGLFG